MFGPRSVALVALSYGMALSPQTAHAQDGVVITGCMTRIGLITKADFGPTPLAPCIGLQEEFTIVGADQAHLFDQEARIAALEQAVAALLGPVSWDDLIDIPLDIADGDDVAGPVDWTDLTGVPDDIADGDDTGSSVIDPYVTLVEGTLDNLAGPHILFEGVNVHVRSGSGGTYLDPELGLGNLVVGYNDRFVESGDPVTGEVVLQDHERGGSHNVVIGGYHEYTNAGGLVAGFGNRISSQAATVGGGSANEASGPHSSVSGGSGNTADGLTSTVTGGSANLASGANSTASGGFLNEATGDWSAVRGGSYNTASGQLATVHGGTQNVASSISATVSGGSGNVASGEGSTVSGGIGNVASGEFSTVGGGKDRAANVSVQDGAMWVAGSLVEFD